MKRQFTNPKINGFQSVLNKQHVSHLKKKKVNKKNKKNNNNNNKIEKDIVQILHRSSSTSGHWFTISTLNCSEGSVNVFDNTIDSRYLDFAYLE